MEIFDIVDEKGRVIGRASRAECHGNPSLVHRAVHVLVFDSAGRLYLQKRSAAKDVQPGRWDTSVGGHLNAGEDYGPAAVRELAEELGIRGVALSDPLYDYPIRNEIESENIRTYLMVHDGPIDPDPEEISDGRFWTRDEINGALGAGLFTPNFEEEFRRYLEWGRSQPDPPMRP